MLKVAGVSALVAGGLLLAVGPANAKGCNGHVNVAEWGCAPWDNNNGPNFPHYRAPAKPPAQVHTAPQPHYQAPPPSVVGHGGNNGLISPGNRNGVVSQGGGNAIGNHGSGVVSQGGGNITGNSSGNLVGPGGSSFQHR